MIYRFCRGMMLGTFATLVASGPCLAQFVGSASATGQFESNSNVFALASGQSEPGAGGRRADTFFAYGASFDAKYLWGVQEFYGSARSSEYTYQHFTELNHNDYNLDAGLNWKLDTLLDGRLDVARTHMMVPFFDLLGGASVLSLQTEQRETAQIGLPFASVWRIEAAGYTRKLEEPILGAPDLQLTENSGSTTLNYLGVAGLTGGLTAGYLSGDYTGAEETQNPSYHQYTTGLVAKYKLGGRTSFDGQVGYSERGSANGVDNISGVTGALSFTDQLTPKTGLTLKLDRQINSYVTTSSSEIDTDGSIAVNWQATFKLNVYAAYTYSYRKFPDQNNNPVGTDRVDIQQYVTLSVDYRPQRWLVLKPYANVQKRISTFIGGDYNSTVFGISVIVQTPQRGR